MIGFMINLEDMHKTENQVLLRPDIIIIKKLHDILCFFGVWEIWVSKPSVYIFIAIFFFIVYCSILLSSLTICALKSIR